METGVLPIQKKIQRAIGPGLTLFIIKIKNIFRK